MKKSSIIILILLTYIVTPCRLFAQTSRDTLPDVLTLKQCVDFALRNQPEAKQSLLDQEINERNINISLSGWLPQVGSSGSYQHYFKGSAVNSTGNITLNGVAYSDISSLGLQATQVIYNNDVLQASRAAKFSRLYYKQNTVSTQINVISDVSKAFFSVLLSQKQLDILNEDIVRLQRSLKDAHSRYTAGVVDKTDYKQATIALNNSMASRKTTEEAIKSRTAFLKQLMGLDAQHPLKLSYDSARYEQAAVIDTNQQLNVENRIEYQQLQTQKNLNNLNVNYYRWSFLPSLSAFGNYNLVYLGFDPGSVYRKGYPSSYAGLSLSLPIFQGMKRIQSLRKARLEEERTDLDIISTKNIIGTEYAQALANYKSNYTNWVYLKQNVDLAKDVYNVVSLQYREGVKTYLDVIVSQSDLRTAELNYFNALFQLLASKIDLQKALGTLPIQQ